MAENDKKGSRDISDLKARLGLKKGGATGPQTAVPNVTPSGGSPAIPGAAPSPAAAPAPSAPRLPPPPGFRSAEPEPPKPAAPDPRRDPFAAAAPPPQAAYYGYGMPLPGTDDGAPVAPIEKPKPWGRILVTGILSVATLGAGYVGGRSCAGRENYNMTVTQAADIQAEVEKISKTLNTISDRINASPEASKGNPDLKLAADLGSLDLKDPDTQKIFHTNYFFLEDLAIDRLFNYYSDTIKLYKLVRDHAKKTEQDSEAITNFLSSSGAGKADKNYGVTIDTSGGIAVAHFVEVGSPVCPKEGQTDCSAAELKGFKYRTDTGGQWFEKPVKGKAENILYPLKQEGLFKSVASGNPDILAARDHVRRMAEIRLTAQRLFGEQKELLADLKRAAERPKVFTF